MRFPTDTHFIAVNTLVAKPQKSLCVIFAIVLPSNSQKPAQIQREENFTTPVTGLCFKEFAFML